MVEMRRRAGGRLSGGMLCLVQALVVGLVCWAVRVGADVKQQLTVTAPFDKHDHKGSRIIPYFEKTGSTNIMQSFVRVSERRTRCFVVPDLASRGRYEAGRYLFVCLLSKLW